MYILDFDDKFRDHLATSIHRSEYPGYSFSFKKLRNRILELGVYALNE